MKIVRNVLIGFAIVLALAIAIPTILVFLNRLPLSLAERLPLVETYLVEGDVRMADGTALPPETVTVSVKTARGKTRTAKATAENDYHYAVSFMGFREPVRAGEKVRLTATMPLTNELTALTEATEGAKLLLADFDANTGKAPDNDENPANEVFQDPRLRLWSAQLPSTVDEWKDIPLASLRNLRDVRVDETFRLTAVIQPMQRPADEEPFEFQLPDAPDRATLRSMPLASLGEELARTPFRWEKRQTSVPLTYTVKRPAFVSVRIVNGSGNVIRARQVGGPPNVGREGTTLTWAWDGKDDHGEFAPEGDYVFVALADSLGLTDSPHPFLAEIAGGEGGPRVRYAEFTKNNTIGDFLDAFGLSVMEVPPRPNRSRFRLRETVELYSAEEAGEPTRQSAVFRGEEPIRSVLDAFGLELDPVVRSVKRIGEYRLIVRGVRLRSRVPFETFRSVAPVESRDDFLNLVMADLKVKDKNGEFIPLADKLPMDVQLIWRTAEEELEDWQRPKDVRTQITVTANERVQDVLDELNGIERVKASIRGSIEDVLEYDARVVAPDGGRLKLYRSTIAPAGQLRVSIRAAGLDAQALLDDVELPLKGDGTTTIPIEVTSIGLDGKPIKKDTIDATASEGTIDGYLKRTGAVYRGTYTVPQTASDTEVSVDLASRRLREASDARQADGLAVLYRASLSLDVVGVEAPVVVGPEEGNAAPDETVGATGTAAAETASTPPARTATSAASGSAAETRKLAKVYAKMKPATAAKLLLALPVEEARTILLGMPDRNAAQIIDAMLGEDAEGADNPEVMRERQRLMAQVLAANDGNTSSTNP